jgi:hypothetical protein
MMHRRHWRPEEEEAEKSGEPESRLPAIELGCDCRHGALIDGILNARSTHVRTGDHTGLAIVLHLKDIGANLRAESAPDA